MADDLQRRVIEHARDDLGARQQPGNAWPGVSEPARQSLWERVKDHFIDRFVPEVGDMLMQKMAQGSAELSQFLNQGNAAYTPYGYAQRPLEVEGPQQSYQDMLRDASRTAGQEHERGMGR
jgi:hypothetical protein